MSTEEDPTLAVLQDVAFDIVGTGDDVSSSHLEQHTSLSMDIPQDAVNVVASVVDAVDLPTVILNGDSIIEQKTEADGITSDSGPPPRLSTTVFSQAWMKNFEKLKQYKEKYGDCNVPTSYTEDYTLRDWVRKQRTEYKKATNDAHSAMSKDRIDLLNNLGFEWENPRKRKVIAQSERRTEANYFDDRWEEMFKRLKRFQRKYGNTLVPTKYDNDRQLGNWVCSQRTNRKQWIKGGYTSPKNIDRFSRLDEIGFVWNIPDYQATEEGAIAVATSKRSTSRKRYNNIEDEIEWFNQFEKLKNFKEKHGHCLVPRNCEDDQQLFKWVYEQQELYKKQALSIKEGTKTIKSQSQRRTQKRITFLNSIDFEWEVNESMDNSKWLSMYNKVKNFRLDQNQKGPPIFPDSPAYTEVSKWVEHQKSELMKFKDSRNSKLTEKKVSLLERIGVK